MKKERGKRHDHGPTSAPLKKGRERSQNVKVTGFEQKMNANIQNKGKE